MTAPNAVSPTRKDILIFGAAFVIAAAATPFLPLVPRACAWALVVLYFLFRICPPQRSSFIFLFLLASLSLFRFEAFQFRPYWDGILGGFAEAIFLRNNHFDYSLLVQQAPYKFGGPKVYVFSLFPSYLAVLMRVFAAAKTVLPIAHTVSFVFGALALTALFRLLHGRYGRGYAALGVVLLMIDPLFLSQAEAINMEMPLLMAGLLGLSALENRRMYAASTWSVFSVLLKGSGIVASAALLAVYALTSQDRRSEYWRNIALLLIPFPLFVAFVFLIPRLGMSGDMFLQPFTGLVPMIDVLRRYLPLTYALAVVFAAFGLFTLYQVIGALIKTVTAVGPGRMVSRIRCIVIEINPVLMFSAVYAALFFLFHAQIDNLLPRYFLLLAPYFIIGLFYVLRHEFAVRGIRVAMLLLCMGWSVGNINGGFLEKNTSSNGHFIEPTLAYEEDMKFQVGLSDYLERNYGSKWIMTSWPLTQMLSLPELGYVHRPLNVISVYRPCRYCSSSVYLPEVAPGFEWSNAVACFLDNVFAVKDEGRFRYDPIGEYRYGERRVQICRIVPKAAASKGLTPPPSDKDGVQQGHRQF